METGGYGTQRADISRPFPLKKVRERTLIKSFIKSVSENEKFFKYLHGHHLTKRPAPSKKKKIVNGLFFEVPSKDELCWEVQFRLTSQQSSSSLD